MHQISFALFRTNNNALIRFQALYGADKGRFRDSPFVQKKSRTAFAIREYNYNKTYYFIAATSNFGASFTFSAISAGR